MPGPSALTILLENQRRTRADDDKFVQKLLYFFELKVPAAMMPSKGSARFLFPLVLNPTSLTMSEPFLVEQTQTQGSGLYVEEHGITARQIRIRGTTGFKPKVLPSSSAETLLLLKPDQRSFSRNLKAPVTEKLSGQRHFHYLQDAVFRTYADLKANRETAEETQLYFHNSKDQESWLVIPQRFDMERKRVTYEYAIDLLAVAKGDLATSLATEDRGVLEGIKYTIQFVKDGVSMVSGALQDLTALEAELGKIVIGVSSLIDTANGVVTSTKEFLAGTSQFVKTPLSVVESCREIVSNWHSACAQSDAVPESVLQSLNMMEDGFSRLATHPEIYEPSPVRTMRQSKLTQELYRSKSEEALQEALAAGSPTSFYAVRRMGTGMTAGEVAAAEGETKVGREVPGYTSTRTVVIGAGDTLTSLAARHLGDARLWQHIAILNGLQPPFLNSQAGSDLSKLTESPLPHAKGIGQKLLIPTFDTPPVNQPQLPVLGVSPSAPPEEQFCGVDFALVPVEDHGGGRVVYDFAIDTDGGSVDLKLSRGMGNLLQALKFRMATERGTDMLYQSLGVERVVSLGMRPVDVELAKFRVMEAIAADPRVSSIRRLETSVPETNPDCLEIEAEVEVRGFSETNVVKTSV